ncbi:hypothetical protein HDV03_004066 [Kappamyces sp. JEL0829]|nr:hypothetical protein HDV03_004066 [Kappamyces sp. JEL0829]
MNAAFQITPHPKHQPIQSLFPPDKTTAVSSSKPCHAKIPDFSTRSKLAGHDEDEATFLLQELDLKSSKCVDSRWNVHLPITISRDVVADGKPVSREESRSVRISIDSKFDCPFPQSHKIVLMDPVDDIFFHWTLNLTPFTYQSMAKQRKWSFPHMAGDGFRETFRRFSATLQTTPDNSLATLTFKESVNGYRIVELLQLDFIPSPWSELKRDVEEFTTEILSEHEELKGNLIQVLETISVHQPALLLSCNELYEPIRPFQPSGWATGHDAIKKSATMTFEERDRLTKEFLQDTDKHSLGDAVHIKTLAVPMIDKSSFQGKTTTATKELKHETGRMSYRITATDPSDLFFHLTSVEITPEVFHIMTENIRLDVKQTKSAQGTHLNRSFGVVRHSDGSAGDAAKQWFHDPTGSRGVVGLISGDFMTGCIQKPERYQLKMVLTRLDVADRKNPSSPNRWNCPKTNGLDREANEQPRIRAVLEFTEHILFQTQSSLKIEFRETSTSGLQNYIQSRFSQTKVQIAQAQAKLASLLKLVSAKNMALFSLIDRPNRNAKHERESVPLYDQSHRFGFEPKPADLDRNQTSSRGYDDKPEDRHSIMGPELQLIPSRAVTSFRLPIQTTSGKETPKRFSRLYNPVSKIDPWFQAPLSGNRRRDGATR